MEDRFKFRAYLKNYNKVIEVRQITTMGVVNYIKFEKWDSELNTPTFEHLENAELMQCTGLKDKNGKLIYEGDILCREKSPGYWMKKREVVRFFDQGYDVKAPHLQVIIGSIYENPDLIKEK